MGRGRRTAGEGEDAEKKADNRPKTTGRGRGGKGGDNAAADKTTDGGKDGGQGGRGRRPQTARQTAAAAEMEETKGGEQGKDTRKPREPRKQPEKKPQDKDSWIYKYHNMERPQYEKVAFTAESVIPALPAKKDILKEPVKSDFEREMALQDGLIQDKRSKKDNHIKQKRLVREGGLTSGGNQTKKGELTERINVAKGIRANKRQRQDAMRDIVSDIQKLETEKRTLLKSMHAGCHTVEDVQ